MTFRIKSSARLISPRQRLLLLFVAVWLVYASTGVTLADYQVTAQAMTIKVAATTFAKYRIQFIGSGGRLLREVADASAEYSFTGNEGYVRAKVLESNGLVAWCQPALVPRR